MVKQRRSLKGKKEAGSRSTDPRGAVYHLRYSVEGAMIQVGGTLDLPSGASGAMSFSISALTDLSAWQSVWLEYRIDRIRVEFVPQANQSFVAGAFEPAGGTNPIIYAGSVHSAIDLVDYTVPAGASELMQYVSYHRTRLTNTHAREWVPGILVAGGVPTGSTSGTPVSQRASWLPLASATGAQHFGLKYWIDPIAEGAVGPGGHLFPFRQYITFWISFRGSHVCIPRLKRYVIFNHSLSFVVNLCRMRSLPARAFCVGCGR